MPPSKTLALSNFLLFTLLWLCFTSIDLTVLLLTLSTLSEGLWGWSLFVRRSIFARHGAIMHGLVMRQKLGMAMPITFYSSQLLSSRIQPLITSWGDFEISTNIHGTTLHWATHIPRRRSWPMEQTKNEVNQTKMLGVVILKRFFPLKSLCSPL